MTTLQRIFNSATKKDSVMNQALIDKLGNNKVHVRPDLMSRWTGFTNQECRIFLRKYGKEDSNEYYEWYKMDLT